jgi:hypothetical protein
MYIFGEITFPPVAFIIFSNRYRNLLRSGLAIGAGLPSGGDGTPSP